MYWIPQVEMTEPQQYQNIHCRPAVTLEGSIYVTEERNGLSGPDPDVRGDNGVKINHK
jgi:hypothetical protein